MVTTNPSPQRVIVLWTGGKDSCLALFRALEAKMDVRALATFVPARDAPFQAHPIEIMQRQAMQLGLPHEQVLVSPPYRTSYEEGLLRLKTLFQIDAVVTGDIAEVAGLPNWIEQCSAAAGLKTIRPLWHAPRSALLHELVARNLQAQVSWINHPCLPPDWIGRTIDHALIEDITRLAETSGIDLCGENGEYHTMVRNLPPIHVPAA